MAELTPSDVMMMTKHHNSHGQSATAIGLAAGLGGGALLLAIGLGWGINKASEARAKAAEQAVAGNKSQPLNGTCTIPIASATAPTAVTITAGATVNAVSTSACQQCSRTFVSETPLSIAVTAG